MRPAPRIEVRGRRIPISLLPKSKADRPPRGQVRRRPSLDRHRTEPRGSSGFAGSPDDRGGPSPRPHAGHDGFPVAYSCKILLQGLRPRQDTVKATKVKAYSRLKASNRYSSSNSSRSCERTPLLTPACQNFPL